MGSVKSPGIVLIDRRFQLGLAGGFVLLQVFLTALFAAGLYVFMNSEIQANLASAHASYRSFAQMLMPMVGMMALFNILVSTVAVTVFVVRLTHRIARPLLHIRGVLEELGLRRFLDHTGIRPGDQLWNLDQSLSSAVTTVRTDVEGMRNATRRLRAAHDGGDPAETLAQIRELERIVGAWRPEGGERSA